MCSRPTHRSAASRGSTNGNAATRAIGLVAAAALIGLVSTLGAQTSERYYVTTKANVSQPFRVNIMDAGGRVGAAIATLPTYWRPTAAAMAPDNRSLRLLGYPSPGPGFSGALLDVALSGAITTLHAGAPLHIPSGMLATSDGDLLIVNTAPGFKTELMRLRGNTISTVGTLAFFVYGMTIDERTGLVIARAADLSSAPARHGYYYVDPANAVVTTMWAPPAQTGFEATYGAAHPVFNGATDRIVDVNSTVAKQVSELAEYSPELGRVFAGGPFPGTVFDVAPNDQTSLAAFATLIGVALDGEYLVQLLSSGGFAARSRVMGPRLAGNTELTRVGARHLAWVMNQAPNGRSLRLSFPGRGGQRYVVVMSLAGFRPGLPLSDGRTIPLAYDALAIACLGGGLPGILYPTIGTLDAKGDARVTVDVNRLGAAVRGLRAWAVAIVLDPQASLGISHIVGPSVVNLR